MVNRANDRPIPTRPRRYKQAVVTWLAAYPAITAILAVFKPLGLLSAPLPVRTLLLTLILVPLMVFVLTPTLTRGLNKLLRGSSQPSSATHANARAKATTGAW